MENRIILKQLIESLRMTHEIEIRDDDGYRLFDCESNSQALEPYFNREVIDWFACENCRVVIKIDKNYEEKGE